MSLDTRRIPPGELSPCRFWLHHAPSVCAPRFDTAKPKCSSVLSFVEPKLLAKAISASRFHYPSEATLQRGVAELLTELKLDFKSEFVLTPQDRIDFLVGDVGIEVKIEGALAGVTRQLWRYAECPEINHLILVTTRHIHQNLPEEILGKPLYVVYLLNSIL
jgi:hypothetical protein